MEAGTCFDHPIQRLHLSAASVIGLKSNRSDSVRPDTDRDHSQCADVETISNVNQRERRNESRNGRRRLR